MKRLIAFLLAAALLLSVGSAFAEDEEILSEPTPEAEEAAAGEAEDEDEKTEAEATEEPVIPPHNYEELSVGKMELKEFLGSCPNFAGWIHGHNHRWLPSWSRAWKTKRRTVRLLTLPSNGLWGDIGYTLFRTDPKGAVAELVLKDFWNPVPNRPSPEFRQRMMQGIKGQKCFFMFG